MTQDREVVLDGVQKDLGTQIVAVLRRQSNASRLGRVVDHVDDQPHEPVHEIFPSPRLALQAALEQIAIDFRECHRTYLATDGGTGEASVVPRKGRTDPVRSGGISTSNRHPDCRSDGKTRQAEC